MMRQKLKMAFSRKLGHYQMIFFKKCNIDL